MDGSIVIVPEIRFRGKRNIDWKEVKQYLKQYTGMEYVLGTEEIPISIARDFPDEFCGSQDTKRLMGALAKAKANSATVIPELLRRAVGGSFSENFEEKHSIDAKFGWYRYDARFALPVCDDNGKIVRHNVYRVRVLIRHAANGKKYLYDLVNIKKETSKPL